MIALAQPPPVVAPPQTSRIEDLQKSVSASRLNCWLQCRLKFFFRYVLQITKPKTAALHFGSVVHLVLQQWNMARWRRQPFEIAKLKQVFDTGWQDQGGVIDWDGEEPEQKNTAWLVLEKYFTDTPIKANEMPEAVEVPVEADLSKHGLPILHGVLDLVRAGARIVDFKTTGRTPDKEDVHSSKRGPNVQLLRAVSGRRRAGGRMVVNCIISSKPRPQNLSSRQWNP